MTESPTSRIIDFVKRARLVTAADVAKSLSLPRSVVNAELYRNLGRVFLQSEERPPRWSVLSSLSAADRAVVTETIAVEPNRDFHVDFAGGDWKLRILVGSAGSRNDPIARVEYLDVRHRLITVAQYACGESLDGMLPDAAVAIAASVFAWEIFQDLSKRGVKTFPFDEAMRDIFLSLSWQARPVTTSRVATGPGAPAQG